MNKQRSLRNAYELVKTKYFRYLGIMFLFVVGSALLSDQELLNNIFIYHTELSVPFMILLLAEIVGRNTFVAMLLKRVRREEYTRSDMIASIKKTVMYLITGLLMVVVDFAILFIFSIFYQIISIWAIPLFHIAYIMTLSIEAFIVFAIHDGVKNAFHIVCRSIKLWYHHGNEIVAVSFGYIAWALIFLTIQNIMTALLQKGADVSEWEMLSMAFKSDTLIVYAFLYIGSKLLDFVVSAALLVPTYILYARIYETYYMQYYQIPIAQMVDVIDVEITDSYES